MKTKILTSLITAIIIFSACRQTKEHEILEPVNEHESIDSILYHDSIRAIVGEGCTMHVLELITPTDTIDVMLDDSTKGVGAIEIGKTIDVITRYTDGIRIAIRYKVYNDAPASE